MGLRFRKSFNFGPLRLNLSKSGMGFSVGVPGMRFTKLANGRKRKTFSIPGTGISYVSDSKMQRAAANDDKVSVQETGESSTLFRKVWGIGLLIVLIVAALL